MVLVVFFFIDVELDITVIGRMGIDGFRKEWMMDAPIRIAKIATPIVVCQRYSSPAELQIKIIPL
jgi:hypothetical protein